MESKNKTYYLSEFYLLLAAIIWGFSFVAQRSGMEHIGPFTFNAARSFLGGLSLLPLIFAMNKNPKINMALSNTSDNPENTFQLKNHNISILLNKHPLLFSGIICGIILFLALSFQQIGLVYTTAGKGAFITALYIVLVPLISIFFGEKSRPIIWVCVAMAIVGFYLISIKENLSVNIGDFLNFVSSFFYAAHILMIGFIASKLNCIKMLCIQFFVVGILSLIPAIMIEDIALESLINCWFPIFYTGVINSGLAYTLQVIGQKNVSPTLTALILSMESVFALVGGMLILGESVTIKEGIGCIIVFTAIILSQLPHKK